MSSKEPKPWKLKVFCWHCWNQREPDDKEKPDEFLCRQLKDGRIKSMGLGEHLNNNIECRRYYWVSLHLQEKLHGSSLIEYCPHPKIQEKFSKHKASQNNTADGMGLSNIPCGPVGKLARSILDSEVMHNPTVEAIDRRFIDSVMHNEQTWEEEIWFPTDEAAPSPSSHSTEGNAEASEEKFSEATLPPEVVDNTQTIKIHTGPRYFSWKERDLSWELKIRIHLMKIFRDHNIPVSAEKEVCKWAQEAQLKPGFSWDNNTSAYTGRNCIMKQICNSVPEIQGGEFKKCTIDWEYKPEVGTRETKKGKHDVFVRSFSDALLSMLENKSLFKEENLSFPNSDTPYSPENFPVLTENSMITELHHGSWWRDTWKKKCKKDSIEILVPVILCMDGIAIDNAARNSLCPLNLTLGIFNDFTRSTRSDAWETIYFHPQEKAGNSVSNLNNLHTGLKCALASLREACQVEDGITWTKLPWNGRFWPVRMKFALAFVIGDTELHDKLCGHYGCRGTKVAQICRHCDCPTKMCNQPRASFAANLWSPSRLRNKFADPSISNKDISHYPVKNAFYDLDFGANKNNIHQGSPGEKLHMLQLGCAKRAVETFKTVFLGKLRKDKTRTIDGIESLVQYYGNVMTRQSDRDFPRTRFTESISTARKEGSHFAGMLLTQMLAIASTKGRKLLNACGISNEEIDCRIYAYELVIGMEEFMKYSGTKRQVDNIKKMCIHFVNIINLHLVRTEGAGNVLVKVHLIFHIAMHMMEYGPMSGLDSSPQESNHKYEIKAPAKRTQLNRATLIKQTCERHLEYRRIDRLHREFPLFDGSKDWVQPGVHGRAAGSRFVIGKNDQGRYIKWAKKKILGFNEEVLRFCCEEVLPVLEGSESIQGFTEHERFDGESLLRFRAHPCYRSDSGQRRDVWYDWAYFEFLDDGLNKKKFAAQILCFLHLNGPFTGRSVSGFDVQTPGLHAVVRRMDDKEEKIHSKSGIRYHNHLAYFKRGKIQDGLFLFHCDNIAEELAVAQDIGNPDHYFLVGNRSDWLYAFRQRMVAVGKKSIENLCKEGESSSNNGDSMKEVQPQTSDEGNVYTDSSVVSDDSDSSLESKSESSTEDHRSKKRKASRLTPSTP